MMSAFFIFNASRSLEVSWANCGMENFLLPTVVFPTPLLSNVITVWFEASLSTRVGSQKSSGAE
jgi:hypothetical protein